MSRSFQHIVKGLDTRKDPMEIIERMYFNLKGDKGKLVDAFIYEIDTEVELL